jgi:acetate kinase
VTRVLCLNAGSSSLKLAIQAGEERLAQGAVERVGLDSGRFWLRGGAAPRDLEGHFPDHAAAVQTALAALDAADLHPQAVAHRLAHGGPVHHAPALIDGALLDSLRELVHFAPLHLPPEIAVIDAVARHYPGLPQVACFDTHFHWQLPEVSRRLPLPRGLHEQGVWRYGFHGLSYEYIASVLPATAPEIAGGRVVVAHLGNGCSACAMRDRVSVATTMGFTALDGLPMGTRCGDLDPGVVLHLIQQKQMQPDALVDLLYRRSGMLGLSGVSSDFRELLASAEPRARFAVEVFCYRVARHIASLAAALGGLDGVVFTAGVGENAAPVRAAICRACAWLGLELDEAANREHKERISTPKSRVGGYVIKTDENLMIARHARALVEN